MCTHTSGDHLRLQSDDRGRMVPAREHCRSRTQDTDEGEGKQKDMKRTHHKKYTKGIENRKMGNTYKTENTHEGEGKQKDRKHTQETYEGDRKQKDGKHIQDTRHTRRRKE